MKYTFLLPAFKGKYLDEALASIMSQTNTDFKVIVSDDCSPEDLRSIVSKYEKDARLVYRRNEKNMGSRNLVSHWNLLLDLCETEYCILASDDDVYAPNFLEEIDKLTNSSPKVDLIHARAQCIDANGRAFKEDALYKEYVNQLEYFEQLDYYNHIECVANYVYRTQALKAMGGFVDFPLAWSSDTATCNLMAKNGVVNSKDILFGFRMSGINISSQTNDNKAVSRLKFKACCMYDDMMVELLKGIKPADNLLEQYRYQQVCKNHRERMAGLIAWQSVHLPLGDFVAYIKEYRKYGYINSLFIIVKKWLVAKIKS